MFVREEKNTIVNLKSTGQLNFIKQIPHKKKNFV